MTYRVTPKKILRVVEEAGEYPKNNLEYIAPETVRVAAVQLNIHPYTGVTGICGRDAGTCACCRGSGRTDGRLPGICWPARGHDDPGV